MQIRIERLAYKIGWRRILYVSDSDEQKSVTVHSYAPEDNRRDYTLKLLESGIYYFDYYYKLVGKHVFVFYEDNDKKLIMIATVN